MPEGWGGWWGAKPADEPAADLGSAAQAVTDGPAQSSLQGLHGAVVTPEERARLDFIANAIRTLVEQHTDEMTVEEERTQVHSIVIAQAAGTDYDVSTLRSIEAEILSGLRGGAGVLQPLLAHRDVTEIMVNAPGTIYTRTGQEMVHHRGVRFSSNEAVDNWITRFAGAAGKNYSVSSPLLNADITVEIDGTFRHFRLNAVRYPVALNGSAVTIRAHPRLPTGQEIRENGTLPDGRVYKGLREPPEPWPGTEAGAWDLLRWAIRQRLNIMVIGGVAGGKTTTMNALCEEIPAWERLICIEDTPELALRQPHVVRLQTREANAAGEGAITMADLIHNTLRMAGDRVVVGELRTGAAMLAHFQAANTGKPGNPATTHATSPALLFERIIQEVALAGFSFREDGLLRFVSNTLHLIVLQNRDPYYQRPLITEIVAVDGYDAANVAPKLLSLYRLRRQAEHHLLLEGTGVRPTWVREDGYVQL